MNKQDREDHMQAIFKDIASRPVPSDEVLSRAIDSIEEEWTTVVSERRRRHTYRSMAMAAAVVLAVTATLFFVNAPGSIENVYLAEGFVRNGDSEIAVVPGAEQPVELTEGDEIVSVDASRWVLDNQIDLRFAEGSRVRWTGSNEVELLAGAVYVSTGGQSRFMVNSEFGRIADIGTRYLVSTTGQVLSVAVREGQVQLSGPHGQFLSDRVDTNVSSLLVVDQNGVSKTNEPSTSSRWDWIHKTPAGYDSDEPVVLLNEIAMDLGKQLEFRSIGVEASLNLERIGGDFTGLAPEEALQMLERTTNIVLQDEGDVISVDFKQ